MNIPKRILRKALFILSFLVFPLFSIAQSEPSTPLLWLDHWQGRTFWGTQKSGLRCALNISKVGKDHSQRVFRTLKIWSELTSSDFESFGILPVGETLKRNLWGISRAFIPFKRHPRIQNKLHNLKQELPLDDKNTVFYRYSIMLGQDTYLILNTIEGNIFSFEWIQIEEGIKSTQDKLIFCNLDVAAEPVINETQEPLSTDNSI